MTAKPSLSFYTNIPTPYQLAFFNELSKWFQLTVIYYSTTESDRYWNFDMQKEYEVVILKNNFIAKVIQRKVLDFHFSWQIFKTAWKDKSQYVIIGGGYWIPNGVSALLIQRFKKKKVAYFSEPLFEVNNKIKHAIKWSTLRILNFCCDAIFCTSSKAVETFNKFGVRPPKFIIPYNIDAQSFAQVDKKKKAMLANLYKQNGEVILLSSGSLIARKGMDIIINAIKKCDEKKIKLVIIGNGPEKQNLKALIGCDKRVILAGFQQPDDIPLFFAIADIFVFASRYDGWAVVINEAIAAGLPIICSDAVGAGVELLKHQQNGWLCKSNSVEDFTAAIKTLTSQQQKREAMKAEIKKSIPLISSSYNAKYVFELFTQILK